MTFARKHSEWLEAKAARKEANLRANATPSRSLHTPTYEGATSGQAVDKDAPVRSEAYRRLVAALPCWECRAAPPSQAAHANFGKGMGMKTDDRTCWPACVTCHRSHDQGGMDRMVRRFIEELAGRDTRAAILAAGNWPKSLPTWTEDKNHE
ncbi:hypothetical protein WG922_21490 [Ramlibacter sp. AN1015]|uniref:hypothetical protein n=1 Tax=Ramlibacter sp. AN1015 TaxID=3133428 RepID=UPI0030BEF9E4